MTLDEAIRHHKEMTEEFRQEAERVRDLGEYVSSPNQPYNEPVKYYRACAEEHEQLAEWLKELKELRVHMSYIAKEVCDDGFKDDADCFAEIMCRRLVKMGYLELDGDIYKVKE